MSRGTGDAQQVSESIENRVQQAITRCGQPPLSSPGMCVGAGDGEHRTVKCQLQTRWLSKLMVPVGSVTQVGLSPVEQTEQQLTSPPLV